MVGAFKPNERFNVDQSLQQFADVAWDKMIKIASW